MNWTSKTQANYERLNNIYQPNKPLPKQTDSKQPSEKHHNKSNRQILQEIMDGKTAKHKTVSGSNQLFKKTSDQGYNKKSKLRLKPSTYSIDS